MELGVYIGYYFFELLKKVGSGLVGVIVKLAAVRYEQGVRVKAAAES